LAYLSNCRLVSPDADGEYRIRHDHARDEFSWLVLGDWGGRAAPKFTTEIQLRVAQSMKRTARMRQPEYLVAIGDNFYNWGVENLTDPMWQHTFEDVYDTEELHCPWYVQLGNHDYEVRIDRETGEEIPSGNWSAQIEYRLAQIKMTPMT